MTPFRQLAILPVLLAGCAAEDSSQPVFVVNNSTEAGYAITMGQPHDAGFQPDAVCSAVWVYAARGPRLYTVVRRSDGERGYHPQLCDLDWGTAVTAETVVYDSYAGLSPDGRVITAARTEDGGIGLLILSEGFDTPTPLPRPGDLNSDPDWSPDGRYWVYRSDRDGRVNLWRENISTGDTLRLTDNQHPLGSRGYGGVGPGRISPDGTQIAHTCVDSDERSQLCVTQFDGSGTVELTHGESNTNAMYPSWHPSGTRIIFGADDPSGEGFSLFEITLADREIERLDPQPVGSNLGAVWATRSADPAATE